MSHQQGNDADEMEEEYDMEYADDDMDDEFLGRYAAGSDSDMDEYEYMVCSYLIHANITLCSISNFLIPSFSLTH